MENTIMITDVPHMVEQWNFEKNSENIAPISAKRGKVKYHWRCKKCGYEWETAPSTRYYSTGACPCCELNRVTVPTINDLLTFYPQADETYDYEKKTDIDIYSLNATFQTQVFSRCKKCGYEWRTAVRTRVHSDFRCPCCDANKVIRSGINDVFTLVPDLIHWYDFEKNDGIDMTNLGLNSLKLAFWKCPDCGRNMQTTIMARIRKENGQYSVVPCPHYNTVSRKPDQVKSVSEILDLIQFWDFDKNTLDPSVTPSNSPVVVHWKCS